mgnify:CR=1 FL=1|jgi:hypothetical protein
METTENVIKFNTLLEKVLFLQSAMDRNYWQAGIDGVTPALLAQRAVLAKELAEAERELTA